MATKVATPGHDLQGWKKRGIIPQVAMPNLAAE